MTENYVGPISVTEFCFVLISAAHGNSLAVWNLASLTSSSLAGDASS